jgi:DNA repair protein RecN (Recombination protein N)
LEEIRITGLGVIADATLTLAPGLTVVTGETGAGKTMVVTALGLLLGGRSDASRVRTGAGKLVVEGRLHPGTGPSTVFEAVLARAVEAGAEPDADGSLLLARSVTAEGRSRAYLGGRSVPIGVLGEVGELLVTVHGQSDQLRLLRPAEQRAALDRFDLKVIGPLLVRYRQVYEQWQAVSAELRDKTARARELAQEAELLGLGLAEIEALDPKPGEDLALRAESVRLEQADGLRAAARTAQVCLTGDPSTSGELADVAELLGAARRALDPVSAEDSELSVLAKRAAELAALTTDLAADLAGYTVSLDAEPGRLEEVNVRRAALTKVTRKYADSVDGLLAWAEAARSRLAEADTSEEKLNKLTTRRTALEAEVGDLATRLSNARRQAAVRFGRAVTAELSGLAMPHAQVRAEVTARVPAQGQPTVILAGQPTGIGPEGADEVELRLTAHGGAEALPLHRGASGGELSRIMLAVEVVFAGTGGTPTMVFDEVDAGVGGRAAIEIGRRLARLARRHQVVVVTHLPQVAAFADHHLSVVKDSQGAVTTSGVRALDDGERARELARMLAGLENSELGIAHAGELLDIARTEKAAAS